MTPKILWSRVGILTSVLLSLPLFMTSPAVQFSRARFDRGECLAGKEAGASDQKAEAPAALLAIHERRLLKIEALRTEILRWGAIVGISTVLAALLALAMR